MGRGLCSDLLDRAIIDHTVLLGAPVQEELHRILTLKFNVPPDLWRKLALRLRDFEKTPAAIILLGTHVSDPDDIPILACAVAAKADVFITGDQVLLDLVKIHTMPIRSPRQTWTYLTDIKHPPA